MNTLHVKPAPASTAGVAAAAAAILAQCDDFLATIPPECYARESRTIKGGTIGKHVRHTVDHFAAPLGCLDRDEPVDYDHRAREVPMETSPALARQTIGSLLTRLRAIDEPAAARPIQIRVMLADDGTEAVLATSLGRELHFAFHHAVHHYAMLKAIAAEFGVTASPDFGVAPSTLNFLRDR